MEPVATADELTANIEAIGWTVDDVSFSGGKFVAKGTGPGKQKLERVGQSAPMAIAALYQGALRFTRIRTHSSDAGQYVKQSSMIADTYAKLPSKTAGAVHAWTALAKEMHEIADEISKEITIEVVSESEPYERADQLRDDVRQNKRAKISSANTDHPLWSEDDQVAFRTVLEVLGRCASQAEYSWVGVNRAYREISGLVSDTARHALFVEVVGQAAHLKEHGDVTPKVALMTTAMGQRGDLPEGLDIRFSESGPVAEVGAFVGEQEIGGLILYKTEQPNHLDAMYYDDEGDVDWDADSWYIENVSVASEYRRMGVASAMLEAARFHLGEVEHGALTTPEAEGWAEHTGAAPISCQMCEKNANVVLRWADGTDMPVCTKCEVDTDRLSIAGDKLKPDGRISIHEWQQRVAMPVNKSWLDEWIEKHGPYGWHITSPENVPNILRNGLQPGEVQGFGGMGDGGTNEAVRPDHVYFYMALPHFSSPEFRDEDRAKEMSQEGADHPFANAPIRIDLRKLDPTSFNMDEDLNTELKGVEEWTIHDEPDLVEPVIDEKGTVAYKGPIYPNALSLNPDFKLWAERSETFQYDPRDISGSDFVDSRGKPLAVGDSVTLNYIEGAGEVTAIEDNLLYAQFPGFDGQHDFRPFEAAQLTRVLSDEQFVDASGQPLSVGDEVVVPDVEDGPNGRVINIEDGQLVVRHVWLTAPQRYSPDESQALQKVAMAEQTGDAKMDALIEQFKQENPKVINDCQMWRPQDMGNISDMQYQEGLEPWEAQNSLQACAIVADQFTAWLQAQGVEARSTTGEGENYKGWHGYDDSPEPGAMHDQTHRSTLVEIDGATFMIDWTAGQFGLREWPMVKMIQGAPVPGETPEWQTDWTPVEPGQTDLQSLPDKPITIKNRGDFTFGANQEIQPMAREFMESQGLDYERPEKYVRVDPKRSVEIAKLYEQMEHAPEDPEVKASYDALIRETFDQYQDIVEHGYEFEFYPEENPYPNSPREAIMDLNDNKHMYVYPTETGYGNDDDAPQDHPLLGDSGVRWNGRPVLYNDLFRAVHDFYGHAKEGVGMRADGEENAWLQHSAMYSPLARRAMTAETRGQNSFVNYGPHGEHNQTAGEADTIFADQKAGLLPSWVSEIPEDYR